MDLSTQDEPVKPARKRKSRYFSGRWELPAPSAQSRSIEVAKEITYGTKASQKPSYADLEKELASTRKNLASNVTLLEEASQALSAQKEEISKLGEKYKQVSEEKEQLALEVAALRREKKHAGFIQLYHEEQATEENRKRQEVEKELEELKKKKFKFTFEAGIGDAE